MRHNNVNYIYKFLITIITFILGCNVLNSQDYGLTFKGQGYVLDDRTGLNLTPNDFIYLKDEFTIIFDIKIDFDQPEPLFGYVLRVISDSDKSIDLLVSNTHNERRLNLVIGNTQTLVPIDTFNFNKEKWVKLQIKFLLKDNQLIFYLPDSSFVKKDIKFGKNNKFKVLFGANNYKQFATSDVPDMSIRDVKISRRGKILYDYPLNESEGIIALDKVQKNKAVVKKPNWLIQDYQIWKNNIEEEVNGVQIVTADVSNGKIYLLGEKELSIYSVKDHDLKKIPYKEGAINLTFDHRAVFNSLDNKIYCYQPDRRVYAVLDIDKVEWDKSETFSKEEGQIYRYQHHNSIFSDLDNSIYMFGGYGQYFYNNEVKRIDLKNKSWEDLPINDTIFSPRYLSGIGKLNDTIYVLGGYGSLSGNQLVNPNSYFDLFGYSIKTKKFIKKFEIPRLKDHMILANSMWIDPSKRIYYALISDKIKFDGELELIKGNLDKPEVEIVGNKIPYKFSDIQTYSSLFFMPIDNKLYTYTSFLNKTTLPKTQFSIHSISYPPIPIKRATSQVEEETSILGYLISLSLLVFGFVVVYIIKRKKRKEKTTELQGYNVLETKEVAPKIDFNPVSKNLEYQIIFFGGFQIIDKNQNDITNKFSPLLKELFLLIWLFTFKNNKGISSEKLIDILWYDKTSRRAQNNRSVNITKLRSLLNSIGDCELTKETGYWKIDHDFKKLKSDYYELIHITDSENITKEYMDHLIKITQKGPFLHNLNYEWLDSFKADISERIINALMAHVENVDVNKHPNFTVRLADCIFNFDSINEEAMILKCKAQYSMGKHSLAENTFNKFKKEYQILYNQKYNYSFTDILNKV